MTDITFTSTGSSSSFPPRVIKRITRTLPDGTVEVEEHYEQGFPQQPPAPTYPAPSPTRIFPEQPQHWMEEIRKNHSCPLTDPANEGKPMLYYCPICNGARC